MTLLQTWIEAAYNRYTNNDPGKLAVDFELIGHADRVYQRLWALLARARPELLESESSFLLAGAPAFLDLPADSIDVTSVRTSLAVPIALIPPRELNRRWHVAPAMYRLGNRLFSRNKSGDPIAGDTVTLTLLEAPAPLTALSSVIDARFPARHHQVPVDMLAMYLSTKDAGRTPDDRAALKEELIMAAAAFAEEFNVPPSALAWVHEPVEHTAMPA